MKGLITVLLLVITLASAFNLREGALKIAKYAAAYNPETFITNGLTAETSQFNYQVGLSIKMSLLTLQWCGGSLISSKWIITAAHCTDKAKSVTAYLGSNRQRSGTKVKVSKIIIHSGWNRKKALHDISLLRIASVELGPNINIVALPTISNSNVYPNYLNEKVIASGWGYINDDKQTSKQLQYAYLDIVDNSVCLESLGSSIRSSNICAEGKMGTSTCTGDSGGPLVTDSTKMLIGITSFGAQSCTVGFPIAFTRITSYRSWILEQTGI